MQEAHAVTGFEGDTTTFPTAVGAVSSRTDAPYTTIYHSET